MVLKDREEETISSGDYILVLYSAMVFAAIAKQEALKYFDIAHSLSVTVQDELAVNHRKAAALVKRFKKFDEALTVISLIKNIAKNANMQSSCSSQPIGAKEYLALAENLEALIYLRIGDKQKAFETVVSAYNRCQKIVTDGVITPEFARYNVQITLNKAEMLFKLNRQEEAYQYYLDNIDFCSIYCSEYLSEAYSVGSMGLYRMGRIAQALNWSTIAVGLIAHQVSPVSLKAARKIRVACLAKMGLTGLATVEAENIESDLLGNKIIGF